MTEEFKKTKEFASKGKIRLFGLGNRTKAVIAAGLLSFAAMLPQTAQARDHHGKDARKTADVVNIVAGSVNVINGVAGAVSAREQQAQIEQAMANAVATYQAEVQRINLEYASYAQEGGRTDMAIEALKNCYKAQNQAVFARQAGRGEEAEQCEKAAVAYAENALKLDSNLCKLANGRIKPDKKTGLYDELKTTLALGEMAENVNNSRKREFTKEAKGKQRELNRKIRKLERQMKTVNKDYKASRYDTLLGAEVVIGAALDYHYADHHDDHHDKKGGSEKHHEDSKGGKQQQPPPRPQPDRGR